MYITLLNNICWLQWEWSYFVTKINIFHYQKNKYSNSTLFVSCFGCPALVLLCTGLHILYKGCNSVLYSKDGRSTLWCSKSRQPYNITACGESIVIDIDTNCPSTQYLLIIQVLVHKWNYVLMYLGKWTINKNCEPHKSYKIVHVPLSERRITSQCRTVNCLLVSF